MAFRDNSIDTEVLVGQRFKGLDFWLKFVGFSLHAYKNELITLLTSTLPHLIKSFAFSIVPVQFLLFDRSVTCIKMFYEFIFS